MNFRYKLMQFMSGRYGTDKLFYGLFAVAAVLSLINIFLRSGLIQLLVYAIVIYSFYRVFSRDIYKRRNENEKFMSLLSVVKRKYDFYKQKKNDSFHIYKKCPSCKAVLRLPHRIGVHTTVCPRCNKEFKVKVRK